MKIVIQIGKFILNLIYDIIKIFPINNKKITFISRQSNKPSIDILLIEKEIEKENYKVVILCKKLEDGILAKISYIFHMFRQMYHLATSKVVVLDSYCIPVGILKHKKKTNIIQMWHALGAFKKFGKSIIDKKDARGEMGINSKDIAELMGMHKNYDYLFASSNYSVKGFSEAFGYSKEKFKVYPMARLDLIIDKENEKNIKNKIYEKYPSLKKKKNILYCPTFRKEGHDLEKIEELISSIDYKKYNLIVKLHPLSKYNIKDSKAIIDKTFNTYEIGFISDLIITDYSAVVFELSCLNKPIYFYAYDKSSYIDNRDFYLNYDKDMPGPICETVEDLFTKINNKYDYEKLKKFKEKYIADCKESYSKDIANFIISLK